MITVAHYILDTKFLVKGRTDVLTVKGVYISELGVINYITQFGSLVNHNDCDFIFFHEGNKQYTKSISK